jgi:hypothetical protein
MDHHNRHVHPNLWLLFAQCRCPLLTLLVVFVLSPPAISQQSPATPALEYRQLAPEARRIIVDEIRLELEADSQKRFAEFVDSARMWAQIASGIAAFFVGLLALLGWRGLTSLRENVRTDIEHFVRSDAFYKSAIQNHIDVAVTNTVSSRYDKIRREVTLARLEMLSRKVEAANEFSDAERHAMVETLLELATDADIKSSPSFNEAVFSVVRSLHQADLGFDIDDLDQRLSEFFVKDGRLSELLMVHYAERILVANNSDPVLAARFQKYVEACRRHNLWERAAPYLLALASGSGGEASRKKIENYFREVSFLIDDDKRWVFDYFAQFEQNEAEPPKTFKQQRLHEIFSSFTSTYSVQIKKACALSGADVSNSERSRRATRKNSADP